MHNVKVGSCTSGVLSITIGVQQGSILVPFLFLLYIDDTPLHVKYTNIEMVANDVTLHI